MKKKKRRKNFQATDGDDGDFSARPTRRPLSGTWRRFIRINNGLRCPLGFYLFIFCLFWYFTEGCKDFHFFGGIKTGGLLAPSGPRLVSSSSIPDGRQITQWTTQNASGPDASIQSQQICGRSKNIYFLRAVHFRGQSTFLPMLSCFLLKRFLRPVPSEGSSSF